MVKLLVGHAGSGKTKQMIELANDVAKTSSGTVTFISKSYRPDYGLAHNIRVVCMDDYPKITNSDEYIGFIYGIISSDHDLDVVFIDGILKHADVSMGNLPEFVDRVKKISEVYGPSFVVSLSAEQEELIGVDFTGCEILN